MAAIEETAALWLIERRKPTMPPLPFASPCRPPANPMIFWGEGVGIVYYEYRSEKKFWTLWRLRNVVCKDNIEWGWFVGNCRWKIDLFIFDFNLYINLPSVDVKVAIALRVPPSHFAPKIENFNENQKIPHRSIHFLRNNFWGFQVLVFGHGYFDTYAS